MQLDKFFGIECNLVNHLPVYPIPKRFEFFFLEVGINGLIFVLLIIPGKGSWDSLKTLSIKTENLFCMESKLGRKLSQCSVGFWPRGAFKIWIQVIGIIVLE